MGRLPSIRTGIPDADWYALYIPSFSEVVGPLGLAGIIVAKSCRGGVPGLDLFLSPPSTETGVIGVLVGPCLHQVNVRCWTARISMATPGRPTKASKLFMPISRRHISVTKIAIGSDGSTSTSTNQLQLSSRSSAGHRNSELTSAPLSAPGSNPSLGADSPGGIASEGVSGKTKIRYENSASIFFGVFSVWPQVKLLITY